MLAAAMVVAMLLAQLFGYEDFPTVLSALLPINDLALTTALGAGVVLAELLALPYLLGMYIGKLMRVFSAVLAGVISVFWLLLSLTNAHAINSGLFSTTLELPGGAVAGIWGMLLSGLYFLVVLADSRFRHEKASS